MERMIRVTGKGKLAVRPDTIRLRLALEGIRPEYKDALDLSTEWTEGLKDAIERENFDRKALKTLHFGINADYTSYRDPLDDSWKQRFEGYRFDHRMKLEFPLDNDRLSRILYVIAETGLQPEISIEFTVADPEAARTELLANAVRDSGFKAEVLAKAAGVKLGDIMNIDYSWGEVEMFVRPMEGMSAPLAAKRDSSSLDIEPDDITVEDTVTVVWSIA